MIKGIIIFFFTVILFLGNIGVPVFTHACKEDGIFRSFFIETAEHCEKENINLPPCCESEQPQEDDCCHDETRIIQLKLDYALTWNQFHFTELYFFQTHQIKVIFAEKTALLSTTTLFTNKGKDPPPKVWGKALLIEQQVFRI
jgi:hypothetical protein